MKAKQHPALFLAGLVVMGLLIAMFVVKPGELRIFPPCLFHKLTGWNCPGCGTTRAVQEILHGNLRAGFKDNALLVLSLPLLAWVGWRVWRRGSEVVHISVPRVWFGLAVLAIFTVWRNLPGGHWLSP